MNVNIFANSYQWLFAEDRPVHCERAWSLGRFPKPVKPGDWLIFRWEGKIVARARCSSVSAPGERDCVMHDGSRLLRGYKVHWRCATFEDLRDKPLIVAELDATPRQRELLDALREDRNRFIVRHGYSYRLCEPNGRYTRCIPSPTMRALIEGGLVNHVQGRPSARSLWTDEYWALPFEVATP